MGKNLEVQLEELIGDAFPEVWEIAPDGGRLAQLVVKILEKAVPSYRTYHEWQA